MSVRDRLTPVVQAALTATSLHLEGVSVTPAGRRSVVKVVLDRDLGDVDVVNHPSAPLSLDEIADATRAVSAALDEADVLGSAPYTLEVTSPGVSRPLTELRHFQLAVGRLLTVSTPDGPLTGRLLQAGSTGIVLDVPATKKTPGGPRELALADIERGEVQVEFNRPDESDVPDDAADDDTLTTEED